MFGNFVRRRSNFTIVAHHSHLTTQLQGVLEDADSLLSGRLRLLILELKHEWDEVDKRIETANTELQRIAKQDDACRCPESWCSWWFVNSPLSIANVRSIAM
jgi:hypothetical protein